MSDRPMRRKDREITDPSAIDEIIRACSCIRVGFNDGGEVYIVPLNFGYINEDGRRTFYFHGAKVGRKYELVCDSPSVGFELDCGYRPVQADIACECTAGFQSVIGNGRMEIVTDKSERLKGLECLMRQFSGREGWQFDEAMLNAVCVMKLTVDKLSCKQHE